MAQSYFLFPQRLTPKILEFYKGSKENKMPLNQPFFGWFYFEACFEARGVVIYKQSVIST
jgi:hypothetical protein